MARRPIPITQEQLKYKLAYDCETGVFRWLNTKAYNVKNGDIAGCEVNGYIFIKINGKDCHAHRLAWLYMHGKEASDEIDHVNGIGVDNRLTNLRLATRFENMQNRKLSKHNTSGCKGVNWHAASGKWIARITANKVRHLLGYFDNVTDASVAYRTAADKLHGIWKREASYE